MAITKINTPELFDFSATNTALQLPTGDTASRPTSPSTGEWRFNSELKYVEYYDGADWFQIDTEVNIPVGSENFNVNTYFGNGATQVIDAKFNEAANFNGSSSYIDTNTTFTPDLMSFSAWVKTTTISPSTANQIISNRGGNSTNYKGVDLGITPSGNIYSRFDNGGSRGSSNSDTVPVPLNTWTHLVFTIDMSNSIQKVYKNGVFVYQETTSGSVATGNDFYIGRYYFSSLDYWQGQIDQVRIFNTALTAAQAEDLYTDETTTTAATLNFPAGAGCIAAYQLDGNGDDISTNYNGTTTDIGYTGLEFQPDLVWIKDRGAAAGHWVNDSVRGAGKGIMTQSTSAEITSLPELMSSFDSNGFTVGYISNNTTNFLNNSYVAWCWKAGGTAVSNTDGTITSQVSANTAAGFSIVSYTGNSTAGATVGHGLSEAPEMIIVKITSGNIGNWAIFHKDVGATKFLMFTSGAAQTNIAWWNNTAPSSSVFSLGTVSDTNTSPYGYIAYAFHSVDGYSKIGSYVGNGSATGPIITLGFEPAFVMVKNTTGTGLWLMSDNKRQAAATKTTYLQAQSSDAEYSPYTWIEYLSNGFQLKNMGSSLNTNGSTYIYMAFAAT